MKNKILCGIISFIFFFQLCYPCLYAVTNEIVDNQVDESMVHTNDENEEEEKVEDENETLKEMSNEFIQEEHEIETEEQEETNDNTQIEVQEEEYRIYKGDICIDVPRNNDEIIKQNCTHFLLSGWAVSEDEKAIVRAKLDDKVIIEKCTRIKRPDVDRIISSDYGGVDTTPNSGVYEKIDITDLNTGKHKLSIEQVSRFGDIINSREVNFFIKNITYKGDVCIDCPTVNSTIIKQNTPNIIVGGWAVSDDDSATVRLKVDGKVFVDSLKRYQRIDVDRIVSPGYGGVTSTPNAGFTQILDISDWNVRKA